MTMRKPPDRDVEALLRSVAFSNPVHKDALRQRLFGDGAELELDDLALAAGGLAEPFVPPETWPDAGQKGAN